MPAPSRGTGQRAVTAAAAGDMSALAVAAASFDAGVAEALDRAERGRAGGGARGDGRRRRARAPRASSGRGACFPWRTPRVCS